VAVWSVYGSTGGGIFVHKEHILHLFFYGCTRVAHEIMGSGQQVSGLKKAGKNAFGWVAHGCTRKVGSNASNVQQEQHIKGAFLTKPPDMVESLQYSFLLKCEAERYLMVTKQAGVNYQKYFQRDPKICGGQMVIKGTRVPVRTILASLVEGASIDEIVADFPSLKEMDVKAVIAFAAASAQDDLPISELPSAL